VPAESVLKAQVFVLLSAPPVMNGTSLQSWKPVTVTNQADGARFMVAFTNEASMSVRAPSRALQVQSKSDHRDHSTEGC
jgi:hypothetical protein